MPPTLTDFARQVAPEIAFNVLATARRLKAQGKRVIELEIGDSPFPSTAAARAAGIAAIEADRCHYCPSAGLPEFRAAASRYVNAQHGLHTTAENIVVGSGAKPFQLFFCEALVNPGDGVLVFSPYFATYLPNLQRRRARITFSRLQQSHDFRPNLDDVARFLQDDPRPKAIFLNSPHNPTGGVATLDDLQGLADLIRDRDVAVFSDEPYDQMVWSGQHHSLLAQPGMLEQCVAAYTMSKSYSMSGWRLGFAVASEPIADVLATLLNTTLSCVPPFVQLAGVAALQNDVAERDRSMALFRGKVELMVAGLNQIAGVRCLQPRGTFYLFPSVIEICNTLGITSHGLAMYLLEAADDRLGVACLGGECFGVEGGGFLRFSCAATDDELREALAVLPTAFAQTSRLRDYLTSHPEYRLTSNYIDS